MDVVKNYRALGVPIDGIIQDWQYWGNNYLWNAMDFLNPEFPHPQKMVDDIHKLNAHMMISIWSSFGPETKPYHDMKAKGMLLDFHTGPSLVLKPGRRALTILPECAPMMCTTPGHAIFTGTT